MSWLIFLLICLTIMTHNSCHESNININNNDKQESCSKNVDGDSLCEDQVCLQKKNYYCHLLLKYLMEENGRFYLTSTVFVVHVTTRVCYTQLASRQQLSGFFFLSRFISNILAISFSFFKGDGLYIFLLLVFLFRYFHFASISKTSQYR